MVLQVPIDYIVLILAGISAFYLRFSDWAISMRPVVFDITLSEFTAFVSVISIVWLVIFAIAGLYSVNPNRKFSADITRIIFACSSALALVAVYVMFAQQLFDSRFLVAASWGFAIVYMIIARLLMRGVKSLMYRLGFGQRRVVIVGSEEVAEAIKNELEKRPELGYKFLGQFKKFEKSIIPKLKRLRLDELLFINPRADELESLQALDFCNENHIVFKYSADLFATYSANMSVHPVAGIPIVELRRTRLGAWGRVIKRIFDIFMSLFLIVLFSPLMLLVGILIMVESGRPVIYKNERVGFKTRNFTAYKFRSMLQKYCTGSQFGNAGKKAEKHEEKLIEKQNSKAGPIYKVKDDPRITRIGSFIRRFSIDELPQFFNVLMGNMSLVGPRPHQPREVAGYEKQHKSVFNVKPGVTGLAQISGRSDLSYEEEMKLDILYIERWSIMLDLVILLKTPFVIFKSRKVV